MTGVNRALQRSPIYTFACLRNGDYRRIHGKASFEPPNVCIIRVCMDVFSVVIRNVKQGKRSEGGKKIVGRATERSKSSQ